MSHHDEPKDNKKTTPTSDIAPGAPLWYGQGDTHHQKDFGPGYDQQDPIPLTTASGKGGYDSGNAITRFGKFGFKKSMKVTPTSHGEIIDLPIIREEGSKGQWTVVITSDPTVSNGKLGPFRSDVEHGFDVCRVDVDLYTLNQHIPGLGWDTKTQSLSVTFNDGETEKLLKVVIPYRTTVKTLLPEVVRKKITYHVGEYKRMRYYDVIGPGYRGGDRSDRCWYYSTARTGLYALASTWGDWTCGNDSQQATDGWNRWIWYKVYTLPLPRSWIENVASNPIYIDNWDRNYRERISKNTERAKCMPNRLDDTTDSDVETSGHVTRWDHQNKIELVAGATRFTRWTWRVGNGYEGRACRGGCAMTYGGKGMRHDWVANDRRISHREYPIYPNAVLYTAEVSKSISITELPSKNSRKNHTWYGSSMWQYPVGDKKLGMSPTGHAHPWNYHNSSSRGNGAVESGTKIEIVPVAWTNWKREDYPDDPIFKHFKANHGGFYPTDDYYTAQLGVDGAKMVHPQSNWLEVGISGKPSNIHTPKVKETSFYESLRFKLGDDQNDIWSTGDMGPDPLPGISNSYRTFHTGPEPEDVIFPYGDPVTGVGDNAQVMFNHWGSKDTEYITGTTSGGKGDSSWSSHMRSGQKTSVFVMKFEDPLHIKRDYDTPNADTGWFSRHGNNVRYRGLHRHHYGGWWWRRCFWSYSWSTGDSAGNAMLRPNTGDQGDHTDDWLVHDPLSAGVLDSKDAPLTAADGTNYFTGYKWDNTSVETVSGSELAKTGDGSPGHGEDGTSRFLYDFSALCHPLSSHEKNDSNLKGYYKCCIDHNPRDVYLTMGRLVEGDPYMLGETEIKIIVDHLPGYSVERHGSYDDTVIVDHQMHPGNTFATNDIYDGTPTAPSVTDRLFTALGSYTTDPVLFLSLSAGTLPGGTPEEPIPSTPLAPAKLRSKPLAGRQSQTVSSPLASFTRTFQNVGEKDLVLRFQIYPVPKQTTYTEGEIGWLGDDVTNWTWQYTALDGTLLPVGSNPPNDRTGPSGVFNTVSLSSTEVVHITYTCTGRADVLSEELDPATNPNPPLPTASVPDPAPVMTVVTNPANRNYVYHEVTVDLGDDGEYVEQFEYNVDYT